MISFAEIAVGAIGIGVTIMVGYLVVAQVKGALLNSVNDTQASTGIGNAQTTIFSGFNLLAIGVIVLAAYGLISVFSS